MTSKGVKIMKSTPEGCRLQILSLDLVQVILQDKLQTNKQDAVDKKG